jgi:hypothetical protein
MPHRPASPIRLLALLGAATILVGSALPVAATTKRPESAITFSTPVVVDPIHTFGEPDIAIDPQGRVFVSGPTGTGTQRSMWVGSVDGGRTYRPITPGPTPNALFGTEDPPGGGDTDIAFDRRGRQYFTDLYALTCLRSAVTGDGGATVSQSMYSGGCAGMPGSDRQWLLVYDPPGGIPHRSAYRGPLPLVYQEYNNLQTGAQWVKSSAANDPPPYGPGLNYVNAETDGPGRLTGYSPFGADGYPSIDQVTGKVFEAEFQESSIRLNIGTPDAAGDLTFLDGPDGDVSKLIKVAKGVPADAVDAANFVVTSMDSGRNLFVAWVGKAVDPARRQAYVSVASAATGWRVWTRPQRVSFPPSRVSIFPWVKAGGPGRADVVWYGSDKTADPSEKAGQRWDVFMSQVVFPVSRTGGVTGASPTVRQVKVTPHPMHYDDVCLAGTGCIAVQGNRNLADFFQVNIDRSGAAMIVYDDTSNGLVQPQLTPGGIEILDHSGAPVVTVARQASGPGLFGHPVSGPRNSPVTGMRDTGGDALYPVMGGSNVAGFDLMGSGMDLSNDGKTLTVTMKVADLTRPAATAARIVGTRYLDYVTRWQMGNTIYYAAMQMDGFGQTTFYAGRAQSVDLCSVSACFPHVIIYPEAGAGGVAQSGAVRCAARPSARFPCTITIRVAGADVGGPSSRSLLEEVGTYAFAASHTDGTTTNIQAFLDNVSLEIDGICCYNARR